MSEDCDSSSGNRIVRTVCKVYNVIYVSNMKGYGLLERDTRRACENLPLIYLGYLRGIFHLSWCQLRKCALEGGFCCLRNLELCVRLESVDKCRAKLRIVLKTFFKGFSSFLCRFEKKVFRKVCPIEI